ncbi:MAG: transcription repressor NadR [Lachnospiraceae bacterium]|nr:transcription repressor NadR [Lachnospiraceae bacterium]
MSGEDRRKGILEDISSSAKPVSGTVLAKKYGVSRQVIVQDIALIRAGGIDVISTARGYLINLETKVTKIFCVKHTDEEIESELNTIVDMGGKVVDVFVEHSIYGNIRAELMLASRFDVRKFMDDIRNGIAKPLKNLTGEMHFHTVEADSEKVLDLIEAELKKKNYLV